MRRTRNSVLAAALLMALTACGGGTDSDPTTIGVTVSNATDAYVVPWLVGQRQKFFENHGVTVSKVVAGKGGSTTLQTQLSGDLPIGEVGYPSVVQAKAKGAPVVAIGGATRTTYSLDFYTMASNTQVSTIKDIKKWGYTNQGSVTQALTYLLPQRAGIPDNDVQRVATGGFGEGIALLESGEIDAAAVAPSTIAANPSKFKLVVSSESLLKEFQQSVITTTTSFSKEHPKVVEAVLAGYTDSVTWIAGHVDEAAQIYSDHTHIPLPAAKQIVQGAVAADHWGVGLNKTGLDNAAAALKISGYQGPIDYCTLFDLSFLPAGQTAQLPTPCPQGAK